MVVSTSQSFTATLRSGRPTLVEALAWLQRQRRRLWVLRVCGWIVLLVEVWVLIGCWQLAATRHGAWKTYLLSLAAVLAWFHGVSFLLDSWLMKVTARVNPRGDRWQIGKYSEAKLRHLIHEATDGLPSRLRRLSVCIADVRSVAAWTWLNAFWPRADRNKTIVLTSGSLHYLEREELIAVVLHEVAHHLSQNRVTVFGGWLLADVTFHAAAFWAYCLTDSGNLAVVVFMFLRWTFIVLFAKAMGNVTQTIEHLCDLFAAERAGSAAMINALLKVSEDEELSEVVLIWVAREMINDLDLALDDLVLALADARPYGRIFHENLIRHAAEVMRILRADRKPAKPTKSRKLNQELNEFVEQRRGRQMRRIRWRRFDGDGDGVLAAEEIARLCEALFTHPDHVLVTSREEYESTTHPSCRDRIVVLNLLYPAYPPVTFAEERFDTTVT